MQCKPFTGTFWCALKQLDPDAPIPVNEEPVGARTGPAGTIAGKEVGHDGLAHQ
ncbi:MAG: hypothetical protein JWM89_3788 [Acidimicrobiales bacterium]|nr:hypothetical protein [Acidimicrobiales bacterium]